MILALVMVLILGAGAFAADIENGNQVANNAGRVFVTDEGCKQRQSKGSLSSLISDYRFFFQKPLPVISNLQHRNYPFIIS